jgi:uncharacterized RDD family membrane protein YckC
MTGPTPDPSGNPDFSGGIAPGLYHAEGDPAGTVRQWDGTQWVGGPVPAPPGSSDAMTTGFSPDRFGTVGIRVGAALLDVLISFAIAIAIAIPLVAADIIDGTGDAASGGTSVNAGTLLASLVFVALQVVLIRQYGGTPGKLIVGLRITEADGTTTPPSWRHAAMRVIPFAIITSIPLIGVLASLTILVLCLVWVSNDPERRSPYDRIGETRVVYKNKL